VNLMAKLEVSTRKESSAANFCTIKLEARS
jgi:hypothetical protein